LFCNIVNDKIILNKYGKIVKFVLLNLPKYYNNCKIWEYIIMPNHIHIIIMISPKTDINNVGDDLKSSQWLSNIIRSFKWFVSREINKKQNEFIFQRQRSFHDHIIRNEEEFEKIVEYIKLNPYKWGNDEYHC
jgi:REP element-mobilizing transposase RayT